MIRHILFSSYEAFKLREFMIRAEKFLPVKFDLIIWAFDEGAFELGTSEEEVKERLRNTEAYNKVIDELNLNERCSSIEFSGNRPTSESLISIMENHGPDDLVCFMTTDEMLVSPVDESIIENAFKTWTKTLMTFSLRLGKNIERNSMVNMANKVVPTHDDGVIMTWDWDKHYVDFSGPLSVHGHYFRTKEMYRMIKKLGNVWSYDSLEEKLQAYMNFPKKFMASFVHSKAFSIDPLIHGTHRYDVHFVANQRLLNGDPIHIEVPETHNEIHFNPFLPIMAEIYGWQKQRILFKFPARGRKEKLFSTLDIYYEHIVNKNDYQFLISIDEDDDVLNNDEVRTRLSQYKNLKVISGPSVGKIGAVNRDMDKADPWDIVVLVSDDMIPKLRGFDMLIRKDMNKYFPDTDGVLWYNDGHQKENLNTLSILGKKYYDRFGHIYWPEYKSLYADNDFMEISKRLGKVRYNSLCIIEHQHWAWGYGKMDELYTKNEMPIQDDRDVFQRRMSENFGLNTQAAHV